MDAPPSPLPAHAHANRIGLRQTGCAQTIGAARRMRCSWLARRQEMRLQSGGPRDGAGGGGSATGGRACNFWRLNRKRAARVRLRGERRPIGSERARQQIGLDRIAAGGSWLGRFGVGRRLSCSKWGAQVSGAGFTLILIDVQIKIGPRHRLLHY